MKKPGQIKDALAKAGAMLGSHFDNSLKLHGDTNKGADWVNGLDASIRYDVMLDLFFAKAQEGVRLCDVGCGTGGLLSRISQLGISSIEYTGVDVSDLAIDHARKKFPENEFIHLNVIGADDDLLTKLNADYFIINGLFFRQFTLTDEEMWRMFQATIEKLWKASRKGLAFNILTCVDESERSGVFQPSYEKLILFVNKLSDNNFIIRSDYSREEYTCYLFKPLSNDIVDPDKSSPRSFIPGSSLIPVCNPILPAAEKLMPYIKQIDEQRWYSNFGPLNLILEDRLKKLIKDDSAADCVLACSGTAAITAAIIASCGRASLERPLCLLPSFTFVGSVSAVMDAGYTPYFVDVDPETFMLDPDVLLNHSKIDQVGVVLVVGTFGASVYQGIWNAFQETTGIQVIIDAAACFGVVTEMPQETIGNIPVALSFHATKVFGIGEGGCILSHDRSFISECRRALNFGFLGNRNAEIAGINGKLSEYGAAVGLAALDEWSGTREKWLGVAGRYYRAFDEYGNSNALILNLEVPSSYVHFFAENLDQASRLCEALHGNGVDTRRWWEFGCASQDAYSYMEKDDLPVTRDLAERLVGLPMFVDLGHDEIRLIARVAHEVIAKS